MHEYDGVSVKLYVQNQAASWISLPDNAGRLFRYAWVDAVCEAMGTQSQKTQMCSKSLLPPTSKMTLQNSLHLSELNFLICEDEGTGLQNL